MRIQSSVRCLVIMACLFVVSLAATADESLTPFDTPSIFRRPVSMQLNQEGSTLVVANQGSGTVSLVDTQKLKVVGEFKIGEHLSRVRYLKHADCFLATDFGQHKIVCFRVVVENGSTIAKLVWETAGPRFPTCINVNSDETAIAIGGLWSRQIEFIQSRDWMTEAPTRRQTIDLEFCPGDICWLGNDRLLVVDAFGDQLAVVDAFSKQVSAVHMAGHRTGGVSVSPDGQRVVFSDQRVNPLARSTRNDVHWGLMVSNQLRWLPVKNLKEVKSADDLALLVREISSQPVGGPENAKADLGPLAISEQGVVAVTVGGVNQLAIGRQDDDAFAYVRVGLRPIALTLDNGGERCFVANQFDDTISVVDLDDFVRTRTISLGRTPELDLAGEGERLFFNARLSHDGWMSCHSCHVQGHTNGMLNDNFSDQSFHTPKQVISLLGHGDTLPLTWLGRHIDFATQIRASIESTMQSDSAPTDRQVTAIAEFIRGLPAPTAVDVARQQIIPEQLDNGRQLFAKLDCIRCHAPDSYTTPDIYDVDTRDESGITTFNPPSLIGLGQRDRYFHDGRFDDLSHLFSKSRHQLPRKLTENELSDLIVFLKSL